MGIPRVMMSVYPACDFKCRVKCLNLALRGALFLHNTEGFQQISTKFNFSLKLLNVPKNFTTDFS